VTKRDSEVVATKAWDSALFRRLVSYARPHLRLFLLSFAIILSLFALELAGPYIVRRAIDGPVTEALGATADEAGTPGAEEAVAVDVAPGDTDLAPHMRRLGLLALLYLGVVAAGGVFRFLETATLGRTGQAVVHDLRTDLFRHILRLDLAWFDKRPTGALVTRVTGDIENLSELFTSGLVVLLFDFLKIGVILAILFALDPTLATFVLVLTPLLIGTSLFFRGGARRAHRVVRARLAHLNGYLQEVLSGIRVVQLFRREDRVSGRFRARLGSYFDANKRTILLFALFFPSIEFITILIKGAIVWKGGYSIASGALSVGTFFQFWFYLNFYLDPIRELGERYNVMQQAFASSERVFEILDTKPKIAPDADGVALSPLRGHVRFEDVGFAYLDGVPVIQDVSFEIPAGKTVAVVGATGAGKSTLVNLLLRFYDPTSGRVTIDGVDVRELDREALHRRIGLVQQEDFLFSGTIRDNLTLGREGIAESGLARALSISRAAPVVDRLAGGLDSEVAERGVTLSTGERELLAIARAVAGDPGIVILDEATSSVDSQTEAQIEEATHNLLRGRSALVIAHRLSTVRRAHRILVLHKGRLRESGTHEELLSAGGLYAKLHALQFHDADDSVQTGHP